jgi:tetratricopeptide (TPR) repeat protein
MKRIISVIAIVLVLGLTAGCTDYLDIKPRGYDVPQKLAHYEGLLYGTDKTVDFNYFYGTFEHTLDAVGFSSFYANEGYNAAKAYQWQPDIFRTEDVCSEWDSPCALFYTYNIVVNEVMNASDGTESQKTAVRSEARFMRAWFTYKMAQFFGKQYDAATADKDLCVPIITEASTTQTDFPRRSVKEVYDFILTEMTESLPYLQKQPAHINRVFYSTGNAMLGKVYWTMGEYAKAIPYLKEALTTISVDGSKYLLDLGSLIDKESGEFSAYPKLQTNPENVFGILSMPNIQTAIGPLMGSTMRTLRKDVMQHYFKAGDYRLAFFTGEASWMTAYADFSPEDRYYTNMSSVTANEGISLPDVYLMYAECLARDNRLVEARQVIQEFREHRMSQESAVVPDSVSSQNDLIMFIVEERIREQFGSGLNWYDMRRLWDDPIFQYMKDYYTRTDGTDTYTLSKDRLTLRIPPSVMKWHPEYSQNE